jgi:hypothetical protein
VESITRFLLGLIMDGELRPVIDGEFGRVNCLGSNITGFTIGTGTYSTAALGDMTEIFKVASSFVSGNGLGSNE